MTIQAAFKTGLLVRRPKRGWSYEINGFMPGPIYVVPGTWFNPEYLTSVVHFTIEDIIANDWEVKRKKTK